jgi:predicted O-methyltransferase YrrM
MNAEVRAFLKQLEREGRANDARETERSRKVFNLLPETAELVSILARSSRAKHILEIGTSNGYSTIWLAASVVSAGGSVISIDRLPEKHKLARENLLKAGLMERVDLRCGDATEIISTLPGPFDFVFFDADRIDAHKQLALLLPKLALPAFVISDNAVSNPDELASYLTMIKGLELFQHIVIPIGKGLSVAYSGAD